jgi:hypothetical protein
VLSSSTVAKLQYVQPVGEKLTGRTESKSTKRTFSHATKSDLNEKISLKVSELLVNPACMAGVLTCVPLQSILPKLPRLGHRSESFTVSVPGERGDTVVV